MLHILRDEYFDVFNNRPCADERFRVIVCNNVKVTKYSFPVKEPGYGHMVLIEGSLDCLG